MLMKHAGTVHPSITHSKRAVSRERIFFSWHCPNRKMFAQGACRESHRSSTTIPPPDFA